MSDRPHETPAGASAGVGLVSAAASLAIVLVTVNVLIVNVAFAAVGRSLHASLATVQWVATGYALGLMASTALTGWASARLGLRRLLLLALAAFLASSVLCAAAWSIDSLIVFRVIEGLAGGVIPPTAQAVVVRAAGGLRLGTTMSLLNGPVLAAPLLGPTLGGVLVDTIDWRAVFLVSVPLAAGALALALRALPRDGPEPRSRLDVRGFVLFSSGLALLVYALSALGEGSGRRATVAAAAGGVVLVALFAVHARGRGADALLDLRLLRRRTFVAPATIAALFNCTLFGSAAILPLYFEAARGESAVSAGLLVAAQGIGSALGMLLAGRPTDRYGAGRVARVAAVAALAGTLPWVVLSPTTPYALLLPALVLRGAGLSAMMNAGYAVAYGALERQAVPQATAALNVINRLMSAVGVALSVVVLDSEAPRLAQLGAAGRASASQLSSSFSHTFAVHAALVAVAFLPALLLPRRPRGGQAAEAPVEAAVA